MFTMLGLEARTTSILSAMVQSFVTLGGDGATRPTFFELVAAERLMPSLKAAITYSISVRDTKLTLAACRHRGPGDRVCQAYFFIQVLAQQRPWLHRVLDWEDEAFLLVCLALDRQSLAVSSATFADGLYGLRRAAVRRATQASSLPHLNSGQQRATLLLPVGARCCAFVVYSALVCGPPAPSDFAALQIAFSYAIGKLSALYQRSRPLLDNQLGIILPQREADQQPAQVSAWLSPRGHAYA